MTGSLSAYHYQLGGSLDINALTYVVRQADTELLEGLLAGEFCYVMNARQMGKSSLLFRAIHQLQQAGYRCVFLDMPRLGSESIQPEQWYRGIIAELCRSLNVSIDQKDWWQLQTEFSPIQRLSYFLEDILLVQFSQERLFIFIDEIDSILSLDFSVDDFFALIRSCYNRRVLNPAYHRLTFALFGVTTSSQLIQDLNRTPFNIGRAIDLAGFQLAEVYPLVTGLTGLVEHPLMMLRAILNWTAGQPFLTQKLCQLIVQTVGNPERANQVASLSPDDLVAYVVQTYIIQNWERQDNPEHLRTIRDRIERNLQQRGRMLSLYQQILQGVTLPLDDSYEQAELLLSGLVVQEQGILKVKNQIYQLVFNQGWVQQKLASLRPYSQMLEAWVESQQKDSSRLLRGQALQEAQEWSWGKSLSNLDYQFLSASEAIDRQEVQQALESARLQEIEARFQVEQESAKRQKYLIGTLATAFVLAIGLLTVTLYQKLQLTMSEIRAISTSSEALLASNQRLESLVQAIRAKRKLQSIGSDNSEVDRALQKAVLNIDEKNRLSGWGSNFNAVAFSPDGHYLAGASFDGTVRLWRRDGLELGSLKGHQDRVMGVAFSPDGKTIASASADGTIKLWDLDWQCLWQVQSTHDPNPVQTPSPISDTCFRVITLKGHQYGIWKVTFSPNGQQLASASWDRTIRLWQRNGTLLRIFKGHQHGVMGVSFSPDGKTLVSSSLDQTVKLWKLDGTLIKTLRGHRGAIGDVEFSPDGSLIASIGEDGAIRLWQPDGTPVQSWIAHEELGTDLAFSPDSQSLVSVGYDYTVKVWRRNGQLLKTFKGHQGTLRGVAFSPDGKTIASAGLDKTIRLWQLVEVPLTTHFEDSQKIFSVAFHPQSKLIAIGTGNGSLKFLTPQGLLLRSVQAHQDQVKRLVFSRDGNVLVSAGQDGAIHFWNQDATRLRTIRINNNARINGIAFHPGNQLLASASWDDKIRIWNTQGKLSTSIRWLTTNPFLYDVVFSPNGKELAAAGADRKFGLWNLQGHLLQEFVGHTTGIWSLSFSPSNDLIASASSDNTARLWKLDGTLLHTLQGHQAPVIRVVFSPDGKILASASSDSTIKIWQPDGTLLNTLEGHTGQVNDLAFSSNGKILASVSSDRTLILWQIDQAANPTEILKAGCSWVRDYLQHNPEVEGADRNLCDGL